MLLWEMPYDELINKLEAHKIKSLISIIRPPLLETKWLGQVYSRFMYEHFEAMGIDSFGEKGEFHTTLVDADIFSSSIRYHVDSIEKVTDKFGEKWRANIEYYD